MWSKTDIGLITIYQGGDIMLFSDVIKDVELRNCPKNLDNIDVSDIKIDSRNVNPGDMFIALKGESFDGNNAINEVVNKGASIVLTDQNIQGTNIVNVDNARSAYAKVCKNFFGRACDDLKIIGVTGTNGKTTICNTIKELLQFSGAKVGIIGTLGASYKNSVLDTGFTTPDPYLLHKIFADMKSQGDEFVVMEASAHALELNKLDGIKFEIGVLTNITEDHLDYFKTMDNYAKAKYKLFDKGRVKLGIVCGDDDYCERLLLNQKVPTISYGIAIENDVYASDIEKSFNGSSFCCDFMGEKTHFKTCLVGEYNIKNAIASIAVCRSLGVPADLIKLGMSCISPVEGRFNVIKMGSLNIVVDYAHTPDGLENVLETAKDLTKGKLIAIFGCGGNRDKLKRPIMGKIAEGIADEVILTSDNPRFEDPFEIIKEISSGMKKHSVKIIENRKDAIEYALNHYNNGETIVIAGKGAEKYQDIKGVKYPYNDFDVIYGYYRNHFKKIDKDDVNDEDESENE